MDMTRPARHNPPWRVVRWLGLLALLTLAPVVLAGEARVQMDAVLLLDSSGSMQHTDPDRLRVPAAKMFLSLLGQGDRAAVMSFSERGWTLAQPGAVADPQARQRLLRAVEKVTSKGAWTNLEAALRQARTVLPAAADGRERNIVLLSDGRMDVGDDARDRQLTRHLREELLPQLRSEGIHVYTVAFTEGSDTALLKAVAEATEAQFRLVADDAHLHDAFASLFETTKEPDMLPVEAGKFMVDDSINDVTVVASKAEEDVEIAVVTPERKRLDADSERPGLRWFTSPRFDMITVADPEPGTWQVRYSDGGERAYIVTDLGLNVELHEEALQAGREAKLTAWLSRAGKRVSRYEILVNTRFNARLVGPGGKRTTIGLNDDGEGGDETAGDGVFSARFTPAAAGAHELGIVATSTTFERSRNRHLQVAAAPAPPEPAPKAIEPAPKAQASTPVPKPETDAEPTEARSLPLWRVLAVFGAVNAVLIGAGVALVWWRRRRNGKAVEGVALDDEISEEAA